MKYESHNYNNFIFFSLKYSYHKDFIFTLDLLIKHKWILNIKKILLIINMFLN
jgi:hypothetical protein